MSEGAHTARRLRLRNRAARLEAQATALEADAREALRQAAALRSQAATLRSSASGQLALPMVNAPAAPLRPVKGRVYLKTEAVIALLVQHNLSHTAFAAQLGLSKSGWSQILNRKRSVTPQMKARLRQNPVTGTLGDDQLWEVAA